MKLPNIYITEPPTHVVYAGHTYSVVSWPLTRQTKRYIVRLIQVGYWSAAEASRWIRWRNYFETRRTMKNAYFGMIYGANIQEMFR
jgi:hypothetical protein